MRKFTIYNLQFTIPASRGYTLVELVVALGIAALAMVAIVAVSTTSLFNVSFSRVQSEASRYGRETIEWVRLERDAAEWATFTGRAGTWCMPALSWTLKRVCTATSDTDKIAGTDFLRELTLSVTSPTESAITVVVRWTDSKGTHETRLNTILTRWK